MSTVREDQRILRRMAKKSGLAEHGVEIRPGGWGQPTKKETQVYLHAEPQGHGMSRNVKVVFQGPVGRATGIPTAEVNWSAIGASSPAKAQSYGLTLQAVARAAEEWNRLREVYLDDFEQAVEDIREEGPPEED